MPPTVDITRVIRAGGDVLQLEPAHNKTGHVVIVPTLGVREGIYNPSVRYVAMIDYACTLVWCD